MATADEFIQRIKNAESPERKAHIILNNTPVLADDPAKAMDFVYSEAEDPYEYDKPNHDGFWKAMCDSIVERTAGKVVLDLGCGKMQVWHHMKKHYPDRLPSRLIGVEVSQVAVDKMIAERGLPFEQAEVMVDDCGREDYQLPEGVQVVLQVSALYLIPAKKRYELFRKLNAHPGLEWQCTIATKIGQDIIYDWPVSEFINKEIDPENTWELVDKYNFSSPTAGYRGYNYQRTSQGAAYVGQQQ